MKRKNYIFTNKKHSYKAIMAAILGIISLVSLGIVVYLTYLRDGQAQNGYGVTGLLAAVFSLAGLVLAIISFREKDNYMLFPWLGLLLNVAGLGSVGLILYLGV